MYTHSVKTLLNTVFLLIGVALFHSVAAAADAPENFQVVEGVAIYLGVMPAQIVQGHSKEHPEARMHGGVPSRGQRSHVVVALFDNATGRRIEDAQVTAAVMELGLASQRKTLESMRIAEAVTYGNYFSIANKGTYHIQVWIGRPGHPQPIEATFKHEHVKQ